MVIHLSGKLALGTKPVHITCGVPQGCILGPVLFLIYQCINDFSLVCKSSFPIVFADYTNMILSHTDFHTLTNTYEKNMIRIMLKYR